MKPNQHLTIIAAKIESEARSGYWIGDGSKRCNLKGTLKKFQLTNMIETLNIKKMSEFIFPAPKNNTEAYKQAHKFAIEAAVTYIESIFSAAVVAAVFDHTNEENCVDSHVLVLSHFSDFSTAQYKVITSIYETELLKQIAAM
jgi:hypothetical protein